MRATAPPPACDAVEPWSPSARPAAAQQYTAAICRLRWSVLLFWVAALGATAPGAMTFMSKCSQAFDALPGTQSLDAQNAMIKYFPDQGTVTNVVVYIQSKGDGGGKRLVDRATLAEFDRKLWNELNKTWGPVGPGGPLIPQYESYWSLAAMGLASTAEAQLVSPDGAATFILVSVNALSTDKRSTDVANRMGDIVDASAALFAAGGAEGTPLGLPSFMDVIVKSAEKNLGTIDAISIPLAMCVLMYILRSWRLLVLPLLNMGVTAAVSFGVMSAVADHMNVNSVAPSLMMSILVAMSIDYSLFLLSRYRDEVRRLRPPEEAPGARPPPGTPRQPCAAGLSVLWRYHGPAWRVECIERMVATAGETISVSALTLGVCFLALLIFPMNFVQSIGLANAITIFIALSSNITITPAALCAFAGFFERCVEPAACCAAARGAEDAEALLPDVDDGTRPGDSPRAAEGLETPPPRASPGAGGGRRGTGLGTEQRLSSESFGLTFTDMPTDASAAWDLNALQRSYATGAVVPTDSQSTPESPESSPGAEEEEEEEEEAPIISVVTGRPVERPTRGLALFWWRLSETVLPRPRGGGAAGPRRRVPWNWVMIVAIVAATVYFDRYFFGNAHTDAMDMFLPRNADVTHAYMDMARPPPARFGLGKIYPVQLIIVLDDSARYPSWPVSRLYGPSVMNDHFYRDVRKHVIDKIVAEVDNVDRSGIVAPMYGGSQAIEFSLVKACGTVTELLWNGPNGTGTSTPCALGGAGSAYHYHPRIFNNVTTAIFGALAPKYVTPCNASHPETCRETEIALCQQCQALINTNTTFTSHDGRAVYMYVSPTIDPLGVKGGTLHDQLMNLRPYFEEKLSAKVYFAGYNAITWETVHKLFNLFPVMIAMEGAIVFLILGSVFRSILIPARAVCTLGLTLAFTFGMCDLVYEHNLLGWTHVTSWKGTHAVEWTNTLVLFSMVVGIGLDYDIFLLTRIKEYRDAGVPTRESIQQGLCDVGPIITAAGIIMAVAFSGLFVSDIGMLNQMGFYLVFSVLFETFVVETILCPALMGIIGEANWWPQRRCAPRTA